MAFCPRCKGEMGSADVVCPHCGYDFPHRTPDDWPRSNLGKIVLLIGIVGSVLGLGLGCLLTVVGTVLFVFRGWLANELIAGPIIFSLFLAVLIFLTRAEKSVWS
jgi:hypothetical protein